ncbi:MAG: TIGR03915 family putative DNA repair protein [Coriobacteriales bacterium]|jgi:hypothetical protein|nr:TIGR03915 family putative DNA repair protein [Coriobacteriales bacterium]
MGLTYLYDGSPEGFLSAVFVAFAEQRRDAELAVQTSLQRRLGQVYQPVLTDPTKAARVQRGVRAKLGAKDMDWLRRVFCSDAPDKDTTALHYLDYAFSHCPVGTHRPIFATNQLQSVIPAPGCAQRTLPQPGQDGWRDPHKPGLDIAAPVVARYLSLLRQVNNEVEKARQFIRFSELEGGLYYARFEPKANVVPLVLPYFVARLNIQAFIIYDPRHDLAGLYDRHHWYLTPAKQAIGLPAQTLGEKQCAKLWRTFFKSVTIKQRLNPRCQANFMPLRFWKDLTELQPEAALERPVISEGF